MRVGRLVVVPGRWARSHTWDLGTSLEHAENHSLGRPTSGGAENAGPAVAPEGFAHLLVGRPWSEGRHGRVQTHSGQLVGT